MNKLKYMKYKSKYQKLKNMNGGMHSQDYELHKVLEMSLIEEEMIRKRAAFNYIFHLL
jgi:hypothetical protein